MGYARSLKLSSICLLISWRSSERLTVIQKNTTCEDIWSYTITLTKLFWRIHLVLQLIPSPQWYTSWMPFSTLVLFFPWIMGSNGARSARTCTWWQVGRICVIFFGRPGLIRAHGWVVQCCCWRRSSGLSFCYGCWPALLSLILSSYWYVPLIFQEFDDSEWCQGLL